MTLRIVELRSLQAISPNVPPQQYCVTKTIYQELCTVRILLGTEINSQQPRCFKTMIHEDYLPIYGYLPSRPA
jgi:hypothetical protein